MTSNVCGYENIKSAEHIQYYYTVLCYTQPSVARGPIDYIGENAPETHDSWIPRTSAVLNLGL